MEEINLYSIAKLQKAFELSTRKNDYFFLDAGHEPLFSDEPFRTETYSIVLLKEGTMHFQANLTCTAVKGPAVICIGPTVTRNFKRCEATPVMEILFFTDSFLLETRANIFYLTRYRFFEDNELHVLQLGGQELQRILPVFDLIGNTYGHGHTNETVLMRSYAYLLIHEIDAIHKTRTDHSVHPDEPGSLFIKFRNLLNKEFWRHRSVSFYADQLNVTPKYLSEAIKKQTGKTAGDWIDRAIILEAKVLLQNRELGVAQVSDKLHFSDQSVFGKFFKAHEGVSPAEYRKQLG